MYQPNISIKTLAKGKKEPSSKIHNGPKVLKWD